jgi:hypothetical protein
MPVLFGNTYVLPVIIVVVLLLLLLLILMMRKKAASPATKTATKTAAKTTSEKAAPSSAKIPKSSRSPNKAVSTAPAATLSGQEPPAGDTESVTPVPTSPPLGGREYRATPISTEAALTSDPLRAVILDILQGWGDLTEEDTKRLSVFRPEKVVTALQALDLPKELKSDQNARNRLARLRQVATDLAEQDKHRTRTPAGGELTQAQAGISEATPLATAEATPKAAAPLEDPAPPQKPVPLKEPAPLEEPVPYFSLKPRPPAPGTPALEHQWTAPAASDDTLEMALPLETVPIELEEVALPVETVEADTPVEQVEAEVPLETSVIDRADQPTPEPAPAELETHFAQPPEHPGLPGSIKTADDLFTLPAEEWADMVAFLEPAELSKVFERTDDPGLKKAIIDTLEHVSSPASLEVLRRCLDDPDPQIQLYALEAADRLLGVD